MMGNTFYLRYIGYQATELIKIMIRPTHAGA